MNSSLDKLVKNLSDEDEHMNSFERFKEKKSPARKYFFSPTKKGKIGEMVKNKTVT